MTVSVEQLATHLNAAPGDAALADILADAIELVEQYLTPTGVTACPTRTFDLAVRQLCSELWTRRNSPGGILMQWPDGAPVRLARDPMTSVKPLLAAYRPLGTVG